MTKDDEAENMWVNAFECLYNSVSQARFGRTIAIFREAIECHKNGCYAAALVMCRGTLESALFVLQQWSAKESRTILLFWEGRKGFSSLVRWAEGNDVLTKEEGVRAEAVADAGGLGAHLEQRLTEEVFKYSKEGDLSREGKPYRSYRVGVGADDSFHVIEETSKLLEAMANSEYVQRRKAS